MALSKVIDLCALYDLHKKRSKEFQFTPIDNVNGEVEDLASFYKSNPVDIRFKAEEPSGTEYVLNKFEYQSSIKTGYPKNDLVTGEAYLNKNEDAVPNIVFVHGWRMQSNSRVQKIYHEQMMELGWNMYYSTLPFHFERKPEESLYSGEYMVSANVERTVKASQQAVADLRALIQWIKRNKKGPVVLIGVSLGGFITNLTALVEREIDMLVSVFYANRLSYSIMKTNPGKYIKKDLEKHGVNYEQLVNHWKITEPSQAVPVMNKDNILLISSKHDQYVHMEDTSLLWESWGRPERYVYTDCGHAGIVLKRKKIAKDTIDFIRKRIKHL